MAENEKKDDDKKINMIEVSVKEINNGKIRVRTGTNNQVIVKIPKFTISN